MLQDALEDYICRRDAPRGRRSDSAIAAAKAAAKRVAAAVIAAGGDGRELDSSSAELLDLELGPAQLKKLLLPLLRLRQACCHPQVCVPCVCVGGGSRGRSPNNACRKPLFVLLCGAVCSVLSLTQPKYRVGWLWLVVDCVCMCLLCGSLLQVGASGIRAMISSNNSSKPLTMDQILTVLISRARVDAEESQRQLAGALNGLAALLWLAKQHPEAVAAYREVLGLSEASKGEVRLDNFQLLHTLHNLAELLAELARKQQQQQRGQGQLASDGADAQPYGPGVPRTLRDDKLASEARAIREQYLAQRQAELATAYQAFVKAAQDALPVGLRTHKQQQQTGATGCSHGGASQGAFLEELTATGNDTAAAAAAADEDDGSEGDGSSGDGDDAAGVPVGEGWYIAVIDALKESGADEEVAEAIRVKLQESDTYQREVGPTAGAWPPGVSVFLVWQASKNSPAAQHAC